MATTCPVITTPDNDDIELSTYTRDVGTTVVLACRQFGQHIKEPTSVTCLASGQWSIQPKLECEINLDYKDRVYLATALVASILLIAGCCWITIAVLCCRRYRDPYRKHRWYRFWERGGRSTDHRRYEKSSRDKYEEEVQRRIRLWEEFYNTDTHKDKYDTHGVFTEGRVAFKRPLKWYTNSNWSKSSQSNDLYDSKTEDSLNDSDNQISLEILNKLSEGLNRNTTAEIHEIQSNNSSNHRRESSVATTTQSGEFPNLSMRSEASESEFDETRFYRDSGITNEEENVRGTQMVDKSWIHKMLSYTRQLDNAEGSWPEGDRLYTRYHRDRYDNRSFSTNSTIQSQFQLPKYF